MNHALITGGLGFIGQPLAQALINKGWKVTIVDLGIYGENHVWGAKVIKEDIRKITPEMLQGVSVVYHLAGIVIDPLADKYPNFTYAINSGATAYFAELVKKNGIKKFIFPSSASVYGYAISHDMTEDENPNPKYAYGISKLMAERALLCLTDQYFQPVILRKGTISGTSPTMRFDLLLNTMVKYALLNKMITVYDPQTWRPILDVQDAVSAYELALELPPGIYNLAENNYTVLELAHKVRKTMRELKYECDIDVLDKREMRNYRINTNKIKSFGWESMVSPEETVRQVVEKIKTEKIDPASSEYLRAEGWEAWIKKDANYKKALGF